MTGLADALGENLKYYNYLEPVTRRLNAPGAGSFVRSKEFSEMLSRLDECLSYMAAHVSTLPKGNRSRPDPSSLLIEMHPPIVRDIAF